MQSVDYQSVIVLLGGVLVIISIILTHFLVTALKKIDGVSRMEERLLNAIKQLEEVAIEVKALFAKSIAIDSRQDQTSARLKIVETKIDRLEQEVQQIRIDLNRNLN